MNIITLHQDKPITAANLVWEEPPTKHARGGKYAEFAQALRQNPGRWAVLATLPAARKKTAWSSSNGINSGKLIDFRDDNGTFESRVRSTGDETRIYVRFVPTEAKVVAL